MSKKKKYESKSQNKPVLEKDLRVGKYKKIPPEKFSGNIFSVGDRFYQVQNNLSWKRIPGVPGINNADFLKFA